jgi:hypothetical protein
VGVVGTVTRLRDYRQDIIDERAGVAGAHVVAEENGAPVMLVNQIHAVEAFMRLLLPIDKRNGGWD